MKSRIGILTLGHAIIWVLANVAWFRAGSELLTGTQLNQLLNLLPAISLIMVFISAYKKLSRTLWVTSGALAIVVALIALLSDFSLSSAAIRVFEAVSGIQNATATQAGLETEVLVWPYVTAAIAIAVAGFSLYASWGKLPAAQLKKQQEVDDNRSIWDQQQ
jgi:chromate transport protein ChrA